MTVSSLQIINAGTKLKVIGRAGAGVDNIDTVAATKRCVSLIAQTGLLDVSASYHFSLV